MALHVVHLRGPDGLGGLTPDNQYVLGPPNARPGEHGPVAAGVPLRRRGQVVCERPDDEVLALRVGVEQTLGRYVLQDVLRAKELVADVFDEFGEVLQPRLKVALDPLDDGLVHFRLARHTQVVAGYELDDARKGEGVELFTCPDVREVLLGVQLRLREELGA